jgi:hypothetical protein
MIFFEKTTMSKSHLFYITQHLLLFLLCFISFNGGLAQNSMPSGFKLLFEANLDDKAGLGYFDFSDPRAWRLGSGENGKSLELFGKSEYAPKVRSPLNIAVIKDVKFGNFVLELNMRQTGEEYGHRDMCIFWGMKDPSDFYYVHMATAADEHAHNIFLVNDEPRKAIAAKATSGVKWGQTWHKVKVIRNLQDGSIKVFFDNMETPIMEAIDTHFDVGYIGFGSFDDTGMFDNIKIWGDETKKGAAFFPAKQ